MEKRMRKIDHIEQEKPVSMGGFSIIEIIIVVVVIAILASIIYISYTSIVKSSDEESAKAAAQTVAVKVTEYKAAHGIYPTEGVFNATLKDERAVYQYSTNIANGTFCVTAAVERTSAFVSQQTIKPSLGACTGHGADGAVAVKNLVLNPSFESAPLGSSNRLTATRDTIWKLRGSYSLRQTPSDAVSTDTFTTVGGDAGCGMCMGMEAGKTYTVSGSIRLAAAQTGSIDSRARKIVVYHRQGSAAPWQSFQSSAAPNAVSVTRLSLTFTLPPDTSDVTVRLYNGAMLNGGVTWWDTVMLTEGAQPYSYADGSSPGWIWTGTLNYSVSQGPPPAY